MKAILFWHGQVISASVNSFKYWRGWVAEVDDAWHFYYQFGRMAGNGGHGSSRVGCKRTGGESLALSLLRDKVYSKTGKGYAGTWYYPDALLGFDFPLDVPPVNWQLPKMHVMQMQLVAKPRQKPAVAQPDDDALAERRSPLNIGWRLDL